MIDFTTLRETKKGYNGANGGKKCVVYNGEKYMLKFPPAAKMNKEMSYANSCISEYLGCHIFNAIGIKAQETLLGTYWINGTEKIVVACKDFTVGGKKLLDFASIKNQVIDSKNGGYGTELSDIEESINIQTSFDAAVLSRYFWDIFIVDALIGNWDRHNGNWGFLYDEENDTLEIAPIYDCGSSLYPQADDKIMVSVMNNPEEMEFRIREIPYSAIKIDGKNIRYQSFITSLQNDGCNAALLRMFPKISMSAICEIINSTDYISDLQKQFYATMLKERYERILKTAYEKLITN
jgi:hypothetical protein